MSLTDRKSTHLRIVKLALHRHLSPMAGSLANALMLFLILSPLTAHAIDKQGDQPIDIISDSATINDESGLATYAGNVVVSQGNSRLEADTVLVYMAEQALNRIEAKGQPARFHEQQLSETTPTTGNAATITFDASKATLTFQGNASLNQASNSFSGEQIVYDINAQAIRAKGDDSGNSRVKIQYLPGTPAINATPASSIAEPTVTEGQPKPKLATSKDSENEANETNETNETNELMPQLPTPPSEGDVEKPNTQQTPSNDNAPIP